MRVLIVDDEEMIRSLATRILQRAGFEVTGAQNGVEGLALSRQDQQIGLAIVDMTLPDIDGIDLIRKIRQHRPDLPCVISTGQAMSLQDVPSDIAQLIHLLPKPYRSQALVDLVRKVAGSERTTPIPSQ